MTSRKTSTTEHEPLDLDYPQHLPTLLRRAWYSLNQAFRRRIAHLHMTPDQYTVLRWLHDENAGEMTQRDLTRLMVSDPNTITSVLSRMETAGVIERRPHKTDRRAKVIWLKPLGRERFRKARKIAIDLQEEIVSVLPDAKIDQFLHDLAAVGNAARVANEEWNQRG